MQPRNHRTQPRQPSSGSSRVLLILGGALLCSIFLCCGLGMFVGLYSMQQDKQRLAEANQQWEAGQKADAVAAYKAFIDRGSKNFPSDADRPVIYRRVIEYELEKGNTDTAKAWAEKALDNKVEVTSDSKVVNEFVAKVRADRERREAEALAAEAKRKQEVEAEEAKKEQAAAEIKRKEDDQLAEAIRKEGNTKRRVEIWRAELEVKARDLANKGDALEARLKEREATYKRRTEAGGLDYGTKKEIEQLKEEIPKVWESLAKIEDEIEADPPQWVVKGEKPAAVATAPAPSPVGTPTGSQPSKLNTPSVGAAPGIVWSPATGPKTVQVNGYTKKDGTVVAPYMRSSPRRK